MHHNVEKCEWAKHTNVLVDEEWELYQLMAATCDPQNGSLLQPSANTLYLRGVCWLRVGGRVQEWKEMSKNRSFLQSFCLISIESTWILATSKRWWLYDTFFQWQTRESVGFPSETSPAPLELLQLERKLTWKTFLGIFSRYKLSLNALKSISCINIFHQKIDRWALLGHYKYISI